MSRETEAAKLKQEWAENPRWKNLKRGYSAEDVVRLRGSLHIEHTLARRGAEKLWTLVNNEPFVNALGALTGNQAMQQVKAGLKRFISPAGKSLPTLILPAKCIRIKRSTLLTPCPT